MRYLRNDIDDAATWWVRSWNIAESIRLESLQCESSERYELWIKRSRGKT